MAYNKREHLQDNISALWTAFTIPSKDMNRQERETLKRYSGFGGLKCVLYPAAKDEDIEQ